VSERDSQIPVRVVALEPSADGVSVKTTAGDASLLFIDGMSDVDRAMFEKLRSALFDGAPLTADVMGWIERAGRCEFRVAQDFELVDMTSINRPDTSWSFVDAYGHRHEWFDRATGLPATSYDPMAHYETPSLVWVKDATRYDEDGEPYDVGHRECRLCGEHVEPGRTSDAYQRLAPVYGLKRLQLVPVPLTP
jgi:hypothetical protein